MSDHKELIERAIIAAKELAEDINHDSIRQAVTTLRDCSAEIERLRAENSILQDRVDGVRHTPYERIAEQWALAKLEIEQLRQSLGESD